MTIDMSIEKLTHEKQCFIDEGWEDTGELESYDMAVNIMMKYQKIQEIYERFQKDGNYYHHMAWLDVMGVIEDGNDR